MPLCLTERIAVLCRSITGRQAGLFDADLHTRAGQIQAAVAGARVLVVGGAGSIGSATITHLLRHRPACLAVLDPSENNLAELVRHLRGGDVPCPELLVEPLDYGSSLAHRWMAGQRPFDLVLSFAALKHVRSERDAFSLLRMLEVNLVAADRFLTACREQGHGARGVFLVSTDKAAEPASLMGASKRAMELLLWSHRLPRATTARFANVLFSDGSLPWGFLQRLAKRQPLAGPADVRRYVVSPDEAGALCLLAATVVPHAHVAIPVLDPQRDAVDFASIAQAVVREAGYAPATYTDPDAARAAVAREAAQGRWPVVVTPTDTSGEKAMEVFAAPNETPVACGLDRLRALPAPAVDRTAVADLVAFVADACSGGPMPGKEAITAALARLVPELHHRETGRSLDGKM